MRSYDPWDFIAAGTKFAAGAGPDATKALLRLALAA
jgi:hypothetical protein